ncbi:hypothetical protein HN371_24705 [Candidatus Poribacteria bacterium]|jgi:hypothetical protein|nr:hypothetical protein [Candidatus Poribacteria bacterium]MBT5537129.1 hypothetical protein [Candidatus Poribacteria bacterium]MBT5714269.1 hypothetical protein [Candidatus Poribacteria bacterium]MBT7097959.1 hypothetical protein [Candidatus Poribacteria bacterium]MBT7807206.1 hypothetical protein [Candidatus Poribacteria bacterium]
MERPAPDIATTRPALRPIAVVLALLVVLVAACGSGPEDPTETGYATITFGNVIPPDVIPPELVSVDPNVVGRQDIDPALLRDGLVLEFTESADSGNLTISAGGSALNWVATIDGNSVTLQFNPDDPVVFGTRYEVAGSVVDGAGNVIEVGFWFETAP